MIDREALRKEMQLHREAIELRQIALDNCNCHETVTEDRRETWERAKEAERKRDVPDRNIPPSEPAADDEIPDAWLDVMAIALAETRIELRGAFDAALVPLSERLARLEGQLAALTSLLEARKKPVRTPRDAELPKPPAQLRLAKP
jgi:hypothetical protein